MVNIFSEIYTLIKSKFATPGNSPGQISTAQGSGIAGQVKNDMQIFGIAGIKSLPGDNARGVWIPINGSSKSGVIIATTDYEVNADIVSGEIAIYSRDGQTIKSLIILRKSGNIEVTGKMIHSGDFEISGNLQVSGEVKGGSVKTATTNLDTHLHASAVPGAPTPPTPGT